MPELIEALKDPSIRMRGMAALALAEIGDGARASMPALSAALTAKSDPNIRVLIAQALWMVGKEADQALPALNLSNGALLIVYGVVILLTVSLASEALSGLFALIPFAGRPRDPSQS